MATDLAVLGNGLSFRSPFLSEVFKHRDKIDFLEIITDHYMFCTARKWDELCLLKENFKLIPHSLDLSLGSADGLDLKYLEEMARVINFIKPAWMSEHISFTKVGGVSIGHLTPIPFSEESLDVLTRNIELARKYINRPMVLENITCMISLKHDMSEAEFLKQLFKRTETKWLLDITNLYVNAQNFKTSLNLDTYPLNDAVQVHYTGFTKRDDWLLDSHTVRTQSEIICLLKEIFTKKTINATVLERDDSNPPFNELLADIMKVSELNR